MYQYFEDAIEPENRDLEHKVRFPSKSTFKGRRWDGWDRNSREKSINGCNGRLVITHNDADGLVSGALFLDYFKNLDGKPTEVITIDYEAIEETFEYISDNGEDIQEVYVSDLNLDEVYPVIEDVADMVNNLVWIDHHEWGEKESQLREMGVDITVNQERCAAGLVYDYITDRRYFSSESVEEIVELTEDHDLWNHNMKTVTIGSNEVCISQIFSQLAFYSDTEKFIENILEYGSNFLEYEEELLRGDKGEGFLAEREDEHQRKVEYIVENLTDIEEIGEYRVAFAHGRASPGEILESLVESEDIDILVHTKPAYPVKASIRSTESFDKCHEIAESFGGGGHEQAAGCKPEIIQEPLDFIQYVLNDGDELQTAIKAELYDRLE